jgi:uncharacterized membrane protein YkvA (DUF1232 family)
MHFARELPTSGGKRRNQNGERRLGKRITMSQSEHSVGLDEADRLAQNPDDLRHRFWRKLKRLAVKLPFAEDLLAAYYCAFDRATPRHVQVALLGAIAYFILPFDFVADVLPVLGFADDAAILATAIRMVAGHITPDHRAAAQAAMARGLTENETPAA